MKPILLTLFVICQLALFSQPDSLTHISAIPRLSFMEGKAEVMTAGDTEIQVLRYDFGIVNIGDSLYHEFRIKNHGTAPLLFTNVIASCACTVAYFSEEPIEPGDWGLVQTGFVVKELGKGSHTLTILSNSPSETDFIELYYEGRKIERNRKE